jgi:alkanesulfonate monooxygenase SsuD/methylene tetrahydromethanopterin reductase-like flavin-dependent oxidoreductase (luciferase family)
VDSVEPEMVTDPRPPIWAAALGDRTVQFAAESADGVLLNWCTPERVRQAKASIEGAAARAGRDPAAVTVAVYVRACVGPPADVALGALKEMTGRYASLPNYVRQFERMGLGGMARAAAEALRSGRPEEVPEELVDAVCVRGSREAWTERAAAFRSAGADLVLCYPVAALDPFSSVLGTLIACAPDTAVER